VLVTGGTGQIGSAVAAALVARGDEVRCLVRDPSRAELLEGLDAERAVGDVTDPDSLARAAAGVEAVVHAAGVVSYHRRDAAAQRAVNVGGARNVLEAARRAGARRLLLTSSIATLGWVEGEGEGDEGLAYSWAGQGIAYFDTKYEAEALWLAAEGVEALAVNPGIVIGPRDRARNGGRIVRDLVAGRMRAAPPGATTMATLADVVDGHLAALDRGAPGERYVLGGHTGSWLTLCGRIAAGLGVAPPRRALPPWALWLAAGVGVVTPSFVRIATRNRRYASDKAAAALGYSPRPLEGAARACRDWYAERGELD